LYLFVSSPWKGNHIGRPENAPLRCNATTSTEYVRSTKPFFVGIDGPNVTRNKDRGKPALRVTNVPRANHRETHIAPSLTAL
jgi:hypothetical protein